MIGHDFVGLVANPMRRVHNGYEIFNRIQLSSLTAYPLLCTRTYTGMLRSQPTVARLFAISIVDFFYFRSTRPNDLENSHM